MFSFTEVKIKYCTAKRSSFSFSFTPRDLELEGTPLSVLAYCLLPIAYWVISCTMPGHSSILPYFHTIDLRLLCSVLPGLMHVLCPSKVQTYNIIRCVVSCLYHNNISSRFTNHIMALCLRLKLFSYHYYYCC
jgi:hypothetical protein